MSKHCRRPMPGVGVSAAARPGIVDCMFHRCEQHEKIPQLNGDEATGAECGACLLELLTTTRAQLLLALDGYATRLEYAHELKKLLDSARVRLNTLSPGAGDYLAKGDK